MFHSLTPLNVVVVNTACYFTTLKVILHYKYKAPGSNIRGVIPALYRLFLNLNFSARIGFLEILLVFTYL